VRLENGRNYLTEWKLEDLPRFVKKLRPAEAGIEPDDVILQVNREPVKSAAELRAAVGRSAGRPALLLLNRGGRSLFLAVQPR
jgi:S1-C subfamily serine protease